MAGVHSSPLRSLLLLECGADNGILDFTSLNETGFQSSDLATCKFLRIFRDTSKEGEKTREFYFFFLGKRLQLLTLGKENFAGFTPHPSFVQSSCSWFDHGFHPGFFSWSWSCPMLSCQ